MDNIDAIDTIDNNRYKGIDIEIDRLTDCIYDRRNGQKFDTEYHLMPTITKEMASKLKKDGWSFDWSKPQKDDFEVYCLKISGDDELQGLIALKHIPNEYYTLISLAETNPLNRGHEKGRYIGTGGNLFAIACKLSFDAGNEGYVQFIAKTNLIAHYKKTLNAIQISGQSMYIDTEGALKHINTYHINS